MKDKFITNSGIEIPLDNVSYTYTEENPRFKDSFWTKYTLPIEYYYNRNLHSKVGHFSSMFSDNLQRFYEGIHIFEGKRMKGRLEVLEFRTDKMKIQIDSGFENLPNFDTKLEDLPLLDFDIPDIYDHANEVVKKKYPETAYNFPKLYTDKYNLDEEGWKYFDSMINNRVQTETGKAFPRNKVMDEMDVYNKNIIHPLPYILYVLITGFKDAGFNLEGDILNDAKLMQRCIYSGKQYFTTADQKPEVIRVLQTEYYDNTPVNGEQYGRFSKSVKIAAPGKYRIKVDVLTSIVKDYATKTFPDCVLKISKNKSVIKEYSSNNQTSIVDNTLEISISEEEAIAGTTITFDYFGIPGQNRLDKDYKVLGVAQFDINPIRQHTKDGSAIPYVFNFNKVNLKRAVPEMTFGQLVTTIKNWRNYDLDFVGSRAIMNLIKIDKSKEPEDFRRFEVPNPLRKFTDKNYFNIKFPDTENVDVKNIFIDENGYELNKVKLPANVTEISVNAFCLKLTNFRGQTTVKAVEDSALMLVYYDGLNSNGDNHATNPQGLEGDYCARHLLPWFQNRLTNFNYKWTFITEKNKIRNFNIRSEIFCYGRRHWIKSWVKQSITSSLYSIEMETETF